MQTLDYVLAGLALIEKVAALGGKVSAITSAMSTTLTTAQAEGRDPTTAEKEALDKVIADEMAILDAAKA